MGDKKGSEWSLLTLRNTHDNLRIGSTSKHKKKERMITRLTALEIFSNPRDIQITIGQEEGKYGLGIFRGPGHDFKPLVSTTDCPLESFEEAVTIIREALEAVCKASRESLGKTVDEPILGLVDGEVVETPVMDKKLIQWIIGELEKDTGKWPRCAETWKHQAKESVQ